MKNENFFEQKNLDGLLPILYCERRMLKKIVLQDTQGVLQDSECSGFSCVAIQWDWIGGCVTIQNLYCDSGLGMLARR